MRKFCSGEVGGSGEDLGLDGLVLAEGGGIEVGGGEGFCAQLFGGD
jgi:hypothetical protein